MTNQRQYDAPVDPVPLLQHILKKPSTGDLLSLQSILLSWEEKADSPPARERAATALALLGDFYGYLVGLETKLEAHAYAELASKMDVGAVGGVVAENVLGAGEKLLERVLIGGFSEALTVLASRQYVKAFNRELEAFYQQVAWQLRVHLWHFSAARRPELSPQERAAMIDSLFAPILDKKLPGEAKSVVLGCLFQVLLLGSLTSMLPA
ncbi:MAG: hypothetical protein LAP85_16475 [Acidobacteriia bacterium]|nr:hypothetical protein [Terriglobia bacterium]